MNWKTEKKSRHTKITKKWKISQFHLWNEMINQKSETTTRASHITNSILELELNMEEKREEKCWTKDRLDIGIIEHTIRRSAKTFDNWDTEIITLKRYFGNYKLSFCMWYLGGWLESVEHLASIHSLIWLCWIFVGNTRELKKRGWRSDPCQMFDTFRSI